MLSLPLFTASGLAWKHNGWFKQRCTSPKWYISDRTPALDEDYQLQLIFIQRTIGLSTLLCTALTFIRRHQRRPPPNGSRQQRCQEYILSDDPNDEQGSGILGVTYTLHRVKQLRSWELSCVAFDSDIVFSKHIFWFHLRMWKWLFRQPCERSPP